MPSQTPDQQKKRTRVLTVRQSSRGCLTCKRRRIKCDETKPECLRCQRSQRFCAGHAYQGFPRTEEEEPRVAVARSTSHPTPQAALTNVVTTSAGGRDLSQLACRVFAADSNYLFGPAESLFFSRLLPQFSDSIPFVSASAAAFGAAYRAEVLKDETAITRSEVQYMKAIRLLRNELDSPLQRFIPFFISSILLAGAEVVSGRNRNAVVHLLSIFAIFFPNGGPSGNDEAAGRLIPAVNEIKSAGGSPDDLDHVLLALDIQIAFSAWSKPPVLPSRLHTLTAEPTSIDELIKQQPAIIHACMHFIGNILQENQTRGHITISPARLSQQAALLTSLRQWLHNRDHLLTTTTSDPLPIARQHHISVLTAQCHTFTITTSTLLTATQLFYDTHHPSFTQIIHLSESVLGPCPLPALPPSSSSSSSSSSTSNPTIPIPTTPHHRHQHPPFSPVAGLIPALALTARKCRDPLLRRQAIALLLRTGKEGPLVGAAQAALGRRVCEIEEGGDGEERGMWGIGVPRGEMERRSEERKGKGRGKGREQGRERGETVEEYLGRIVPEERRVRACWRVSLALPERLGGVVRFARVVDTGSMRGWVQREVGADDVSGETAQQMDGVADVGAGGGRGGEERPMEQEEMHLEVWAERVPEFEIVDNGKAWATVRKAEVWNEWLDPKAWRLLPFEII